MVIEPFVFQNASLVRRSITWTKETKLVWEAAMGSYLLPLLLKLQYSGSKISTPYKKTVRISESYIV